MATDPVKAAAKHVADVNAEHYRLLKARDEITDQMRENSVELADATDALHAAEQEAAAEARAVDLSGAVAPADPPPTKTVSVGQVSESAKAGRR